MSRFSLLTGGAERAIKRPLPLPPEPDRLDTVLESLTVLQAGADATLRRALEMERSLEDRVAKKAAEITEPERRATQEAQAQAKAAHDRAEALAIVAQQSAEALRLSEENLQLQTQQAALVLAETQKALAKKPKVVEKLVDRVVEKYIERPLKNVRIDILKNGEDRIRRFILKADGRQDITLDVLRSADGRIRNLVEGV